MSEAGRGVLIAVEGADGAGTTTQCRRLAEWLTRRGRRVLSTREPSGGEVGVLLRAALEGRAAPGVRDAEVMALLFAADRVEHVRREVLPALGEGQVVLTDRYVLSSLVYQSASLPRAWVAELNRFAPAPDLTILVDVSPEVAAARRARRGGAEELFDADEVQRGVIARYRAEAERLANAGAAITVVDGTPDADAVFAAILGQVAPRCGVAIDGESVHGQAASEENLR